MIARAECPYCCAERLTIGVGRYLVCPECGLSYDHVFAPRERCTSADLAAVLRAASLTWWGCALRERVHNDKWQGRFVARAVSLAAFWGRNGKERMAR